MDIDPKFRILAVDLIDKYAKAPTTLLQEAMKLDDTYDAPGDIALLGLHFWPLLHQFLETQPEAIQAYYNSLREKGRLLRSKRTIAMAVEQASKLIDEDKLAEAQGVILNGYHLSNRQLKESKPIRTFGERWAEFTEKLKQWRNREVIGFKTSMPTLTDSLLGLRGLILLGAPTNLGKTILALQFALDALQEHEDTCCIFLSLEMHVDDLMTRACCRATSEDWKTFVLKGDDAKVEQAGNKLKSIWNRLIIVDRDDFNEDEGIVLQLAAELRERTGSTRTFLIVDYLQVWEPPINIEQAFRTDTDADRWRIEAMKRLKNSLQKDDALLVISEMRKRDQGNKERLAVEDLMGSARLAYAADTVLLWHKMSSTEKFQYFDTAGSGIVTSHPHKGRTLDKLNKDVLAEEVEKLENLFNAINTQCYWLEIAKGRDGTVRKVLPITAHYNQLTITEGFMTNGLAGIQLSKESQAYDAIEDPFDTPANMDEREMQSVVSSRETEGDNK